ncbi:MAG: acyltransferase family protein [Chloroflexota bacterium]
MGQRTEQDGAGARAGFRPDIEGMRGIAVALVVLFHAGPFGVTGGFIGVDVFFVLSGFLITGLLLREAETRRRIDLGGFYARRIRRLLPAGALVLAVTLLAAPFAVAPIDLPVVALDGAAAALSVANLRFAAESGYFATAGDPSPFLHFWSLSVEEQFYLVWPVLVALGVRVGRPRITLGILLAAITVASLAGCIALTATDPDLAFFLLPTRAWQLGVGGLLAIVAVRAGNGGRLRGVVGWVGLGAIVVAALTIDETMAWPGALALVPTLGAAAVIAGGRAPAGPGRFLSVPPLRFLGRISYALYLWHWPLLVLPATAIGAPLSVEARLLLVAASVGLATLSTFLLEEPIRAGRLSVGWPSGRTIGAGLTALLGVVALSAGLLAATSLPGYAGPTEPRIGAVDGPGVAASPAAVDTDAEIVFGSADASPGPDDEDGGELVIVLPGDEESPPPAPSTDPSASAVPALDTTPAPAVPPAATAPALPTAARPTQAAAPSGTPAATPPPSAGPTSPPPTERPRPTPRPTPISWRLPADSKPRLAVAREDDERLRADGCLAYEGVRVPPVCVYGDPRGRFGVALVGDSHAAHWFPALERVAKERGWKLLTFTKVSCQFTELLLYNLSQKRAYPECGDFVRNTIERLRRAKPDLVVTSQLRFNYTARTQDESPVVQGEAIGRALRQVDAIRVVIVDTPWVRHDVPRCLSRNTVDVRACSASRWDLRLGGAPERDKAIARVGRATILDFSRIFCDKVYCPVAMDGYIRFRDDHHLTASYARSLAPTLGKALDKLVERARATPRPSPAPTLTPAP